MFDSDLSLKAHVSQLTACCYSCLRRVKSCRCTLTRITAATIVISLIVTRLDYCNSLLAGYTKQTLDKLQRVLNCSARVIFGGDSRLHVTPLTTRAPYNVRCSYPVRWKQLVSKVETHCSHWLRARERISFTVCLLVYQTIHGLAPCYVN